MKKLFITIAFVAAACFAQAQFFVGGSIGFGTTGGTVTSESAGISVSADQPKTMNFTIAPSLGFMFSDNMGVGLDLYYGYAKSTRVDKTATPEITTTVKGSTIGFKPYFRYVFAEVDNFRFYGDAFVQYQTGKPTVTVEQGGVSLSGDGDKTTKLGFGIQPGLAYMLTDNISMNCQINLLTIGYSTAKVVNETTDAAGDKTTVTTKDNTFGLGINEASDITIGFFYTF